MKTNTYYQLASRNYSQLNYDSTGTQFTREAIKSKCNDGAAFCRGDDDEAPPLCLMVSVAIKQVLPQNSTRSAPKIAAPM